MIWLPTAVGIVYPGMNGLGNVYAGLKNGDHERDLVTIPRFLLLTRVVLDFAFFSQDMLSVLSVLVDSGWIRTASLCCAVLRCTLIICLCLCFCFAFILLFPCSQVSHSVLIRVDGLAVAER
jgi:hypothetical protein